MCQALGLQGREKQETGENNLDTTDSGGQDSEEGGEGLLKQAGASAETKEASEAGSRDEEGEAS